MQATEAIMVVMVVGMTIGIPAMALSLRFALKPLVEAWVRLKEANALGASHAELAALRERVTYLERLLDVRGTDPLRHSDVLGRGEPVMLPPMVNPREKA